MKAIKYLFMSALLMGFSTAATAQDGTKADVDAVKQLIKSNPADLAKQMKAYYGKNKKNAENLVAFGQAFFEAKDTVNARIAATTALKAAKNSYAPAYVLLGDIAALGEDGGEAAKNYEMAIHFDPTYADAYRKYATVYRKVSLTGALSKLDELRQHRPDYPVDALKAHLNYLSLKYSSAVDDYAKVPVSQLTRRDFAEYAFSLYKNKKYDEALNIIGSGLKLDDKNATLNRLGLYCAVEQKDTKQALRFADVLFNKIDKDSVNITDKDFLHYGRAYAIDSLFDQAIEKYRGGLALNNEGSTDKPELIKNISDSYKGMKKYPEAIQEYQNYMAALESVDANDYAGLGTLHMLNARSFGDEDPARAEALRQADKVFAELIEKHPEAQEYGYFQRARANNMLDPTSEQGLAKPYFEKVIELISARENLDTIDKSRLENSYRYLLGYYNSVAKDKVNALECAKKVQELAPSDAINQLVESLSKSVGQ